MEQELSISLRSLRGEAPANSDRLLLSDFNLLVQGAVMNRRTFLKTTAAGLAVGVGSAPAIGQPSGSGDRVRLGFIGTGRMGRSNLRYALATERTEVVALCDVYRPNLDLALEQVDGQAATYVDFRELLERSDVDAVVVSTPDHWHAAQTVMACHAGKDVFVEKPLATTVAEGRRMVDVARETGRVVQVGTMQRSAEHFERAAMIVRSGELGKISFVRCWNTSNQYPDGIGSPRDSAPPSDLDWDLWLGPAEERPFNWNRFGVNDDTFSTFRWFWDYAGGMLTDWGVHLIDIVLWAMNAGAPNVVTASGGKFHVQDNRDTPDTLQATYEFDDWVMTYTNQICNGRGFHERGYGILFHGTNGSLFVDRGGYELLPEYDRDDDDIETRPRTAPRRARSISSGNLAHHHNWLDCIETRERPICDVEIGHLSSVPPHLGNIAYRTGSRLVWDGQRERCIGNDAANELLMREYRRPWVL